MTSTDNNAPVVRRRTLRVAVLISIPLFFLFIWLTMFWQLAHINDPGMYWNVSHLRWQRQDLIKHFPESLPDQAEASRLHYHAGFLQGGSHLELRFRADAAFIDDVRTRYAKQAVPSDLAGKALKQRYFYTISNEPDIGLRQMTLPNSFEVFVISDNAGNHGDASGFAISDTQHEIIYWAEKW